MTDTQRVRQPLLSVIVPVYKTERYIENFTRSLLEQTYNNLEIIFVNDATPDRSIEIVERLVKEYPERSITVLHNSKNLGLGATRFVGFDAAKGEYLYTCDSDDRLDHEMLETLMTEAVTKDADMVACNILSEFSDHSEVRAYSVEDEETQKNGLLAVKIGEAEVSLCNKVFRRRLLVDNNIRPCPNVNMGEDSAITVKLRYFSRKTIIVAKPMYYYNKTNDNAMTYKPKKEILAQYAVLARHIEQFFKDQGCARQYRHLINWYKFNAKREYVRHYRDFRTFKELFAGEGVCADIFRFDYLTKLGRIKWIILSMLPKFLFKPQPENNNDDYLFRM